MKFQQFKLISLLLAACCLVSCTREGTTAASENSAVAAATPSPAPTQKTELDVPYVPTHQSIVDQMLSMAEVTGNDVLYDLGSGDGRIPITAAKRFGTRGVGIDIDPIRISQANGNAEDAKVTDKVRFTRGDIFATDFREATVVTLYLLPEINLRLRPILFEQLKPGTRVVSHNYDMGDWQPEKTATIKTPDGVDHFIYFWRVPEKKQ